MATIRIDLAAENRASREVLRLRGEINNLGEQIARNNQRTAAGTAAERAKTAETNRGLRAQQGLLRAQQQRNAITLAGLRQETGLLANVRAQTGLLSRATGGLVTQLGAIGALGVARELFEFGSEAVGAAVKVEGFRNSLTALHGSAAVAESVLADLQELAQLPGITFQGAVQGAVRLKTVGVEGQFALDILREFGNAAALGGSSAAEMGRAMVGLTQILSRGKLSQEELNQVLEAVPLIGNSIRASFNSIDAENIRTQLEAAGQDVTDFVRIITEELATGARASADSTANAFSNLQNATFELQAAIGDRLTPVVKDATTGLTGLFNTITDFIEGTNDATRSAESYASAIMMAGDAAAVNRAIQERVTFLQGEVAALEAAAAGSANYFRIRGRETDPGREYRLAKEELEGLIEAQASGTAATVHFTNEQNRLIGESRVIIQNIADLEARRAGENIRQRANTNRLIGEEREALAALQTQIGDNATVLRALTTVNTQVAETTEDATAAINSQAEALRDAALAYGEQVRAAGDVRENLQALSEAQAILNIHWRVASRQLPDYAAAIDTVIPSVINLTEAENALTAAIDANQEAIADEIGDVDELLAILPQLSTGLTSLAADQAIATAEIRLLNPAISDAVDSLRDYNDVMLEAGINFRDVEDISADLTQSIRDQSSAFDDLRGDVESAAISLDDIDDTFNRIPDAIDPAILSMEDFETVALRALRDIGNELSAFEGNLGGVGTGIDNLVTLFSNPVSFAAGTLGAVIEGLSRINAFGGPLGLPEGFFDDPVGGQAQVDPRNIRAAEDQAQLQTHLAGIGRYLNTPGGIDIIRENAPELFHRPGTREFIEQNYPELVDQIYPRGQGFNVSGTRAGTRAAQSIAEATGTDRQAIEDAAEAMYGPEDYAAEVAAATGEALSDIPEPDLPPEIADPLGTFRLTGAEGEILAPYETAVRRAQNAVDDLTADSTPQEIADAYEGLIFAQTNLSTITEGIIQAAEETGRITGTAATNAITALGLDLGDDIRRANNSLISSLGDVGFEVVGGIENIREAIDVSNISSAFRRIPEEVEQAAAEEPEPEAEVSDPEVQRDVHRFSAAENTRLRILQAAVSAAEDAVGLLDENSTEAEITEAYGTLANAERNLYATKVGFIQSATGITDDARQRAFDLAEGLFGREIFDANQDLVKAFEDVGLQLVTGITATTGILRGTALATQQIPQAVEEAEAAEVDPDDPLAPLRSNVALAENAVRRTRFDLTQATSEEDFETRRLDLVGAINAAYDTQIALLDALGLSEQEYEDRAGDALLTRDMALARATTATNTFAEARIKGEEDAAEAAQDAADEKIAAEERDARERMRITERQQREEERAIEMRLRDEMRLQGALTDLLDDTLDAERDHLQRSEDLHQRHADRLMQIETRRLQEEADARQDHFRTQEDIILATARRLFDQPITSASDLTAEQFRQVTADTGFREDISDLRREERRSDIDAGISDERATQAANQELTNSLLEGDMQLSESRNALLTQAVISLEALVTQSSFSAGARGDILASLSEAGVVIPNLAGLLSAAAPVSPPNIIQGQGAQGVSRPSDVNVNVQVDVRNSDVMLNEQKVGQIVGDVIVKQGQQGRNLLGD